MVQVNGAKSPTAVTVTDPAVSEAEANAKSSAEDQAKRDEEIANAVATAIGTQLIQGDGKDNKSSLGLGLAGKGVLGDSVSGLQSGAKANADQGLQALSEQARVNEGTSTSARQTVEKDRGNRVR